jgi:Transcription factor Tfb2 (p52) C-terminal domain
VTVQDQIRLWELERNRIKTQEGKPGNLLEPVNTFESFILLDLLLTFVQVSYTPRLRRKPTTNLSSITHDSLTSFCGKTRRSAAFLAASRAMRIFVDLLNDVLVAVVGR